MGIVLSIFAIVEDVTYVQLSIASIAMMHYSIMKVACVFMKSRLL